MFHDIVYTEWKVIMALSPTLHHGDWVLHSGPKDIRSEHSGQILDTHLILIGVRLNLI